MDTADNFFGDQDDMELEQIIEGRADYDVDDEDDDRRGSDDEAIEAPAPKKDDEKADEGKKKRVMAPRPKLDATRLASDRGLLALEAEMRGVKLKGRGHELADLDLILGRLQHWAHRLFPSYTFDDCLDKLEKLGSKKNVATQVKKIRMGLSSVDDIMDTTLRGDDYVPDDDDNDAAPQERPPAVNPEAAFNDLMVTEQYTAPPQPPQPSKGLTEEQKARMLKNRLAAEERRLARLKEQQEQEKRRQEEEEALAAMAELEQEGL